MKLLSMLMFMCSILMAGCSTATVDTESKRFDVPFTESQPPPEPSPGQVVPVTGDVTDENLAVLESFGIEYGSIVFPVEKAMAVAQLRLYAEQVYADSEFNRQLGEMHTDMLYERLQESERLRRVMFEQQNTWWARNSGTVYLLGGFSIGSLATVFIVYGLNQASN